MPTQGCRAYDDDGGDDDDDDDRMFYRTDRNNVCIM